MYLEARIQVTSKTAAADLIVSTQSESKTFVGFFPATTNNSFVELGISGTGSASVTVFKDGLALPDDPISNVGTDDLNFVPPSPTFLELHPGRSQRDVLQSDLLSGRLEETDNLWTRHDQTPAYGASGQLYLHLVDVQIVPKRSTREAASRRLAGPPLPSLGAAGITCAVWSRTRVQDAS